MKIHSSLLLLGAALSLSVASPATRAEEDPLPPTVLQNSTYTLPGLGEVTLREGSYRDEARGVTVALEEDAFGLGDINGDRQRDAAVILTVTAVEAAEPASYLAVLGGIDNAPQSLTTTLLSSRAQVRAVEVAKERVLVTLAIFGPDDAFCCPSEILTQAYRFDPRTQELKIASIDDQRLDVGNNNDGVRFDPDFSSGSTDPNLGDTDQRTGGGVRFPF